MSKIFLSYRRDDSAAYAGRLYDRLVAHFGQEQIFMDIDRIEPGEDFVEVIKDSVGASSVLIVLIGRQWGSLVDATGARRLDNPEDFVRLEVGAALERKIRVIPVLVGGASVPRGQDLPEPLQPLARRQAIDISDTRFHTDVDRLIEAIERGLSVATAPGATAPTANAVSGHMAPVSTPEQTVHPPTSDLGPDRATPLDAKGRSEVPSPDPKRQSQAPVLNAQSVHGPKEGVRASGANLKLVLAGVGIVVVVLAVGVLTLRKSADIAPAIDPNRQTPLVAEIKPQATPTAPAYKGPPVTLRGQDTYPPKYPHSAAFRALADALNKIPSGSIQLESLPAGAVVPAFQAMDAVAGGALDAAWVSPGYFFGRHTAFALIDGPPFGPNPLRYAQWRQDGSVAALADELYRSFGVKSIFCGVVGPYADVWSMPRIRGSSDLKGLKIRAVGIESEIFAKAGAVVRVLSVPEILPAMERRILDAAQVMDLASGVPMGLNSVTKFLYYPGTITPAAGLDFIVNAQKWDQLPRGAQAALEQACEGNVQEMLDWNEAEQRTALSTLVSKGVQVQPLPAPVVSILRAAWQKVAAEKSSNPLFLKLLDSIRPYERGG